MQSKTKMQKIKKKELVQKKHLINYLVLSGSILAIIYAFLSGFDTVSQNIVGLFVIVVSFALCYVYRNDTALAIMFVFIAYANYSVVVGVYWFPRIRPNGLYEQVASSKVYGQAIVSMLVFVVVLYITRDYTLPKLEIPHLKKRINIFEPLDNVAPLIGYCSSIAYIIIFLTQFRLNEGERASGSALGEYRYIFMLFAVIGQKKTTGKKVFWTVLISTISTLVFLGGNRVDAIPSILLLLFLWYPNVRISKLIPFIPAIIIVFKMIGAMRYEFSLTLQGITNTISLASQELYTQDTFTYAYLPSLLAMQLSQAMNWMDKLWLFIDNLLYIPIGGSFASSLLPNLTRNYYVHYFGFFAPLTFNFWIGYASPFIVALIVRKFVNNFEEHKQSKHWKCKAAVALCGISIVPRWYGYNFLQLLRMAILISVIWIVIQLVNNVLSVRKTERK